MTKIDVSVRNELRAASDGVVEDAVEHADPMVLRGLLQKLTDDPEVAAISAKTVMTGVYEVATPTNEETQPIGHAPIATPLSW